MKQKQKVALQPLDEIVIREIELGIQQGKIPASFQYSEKFYLGVRYGIMLTMKRTREMQEDVGNN
jgi:hypothetical protein